MAKRVPAGANPGPRADGARLLADYLRREGVALYAFCNAHKLNRFCITRALTGKTVRMLAGLALDIDRATNGAVPVAAWHPNTIRLDSQAPAAVPARAFAKYAAGGRR